MDELTLLRALDADTPAPSRTALECAFDALSVRMTAADERPGRHSAARRRRRSDRLRWAAVVSGAVVAVVVADLIVQASGAYVWGVRRGELCWQKTGVPLLPRRARR